MYRKKLLSTDDFSYYRKRSIIHDSDDDLDTFKFDSFNNFVDIEDMDEDKMENNMNYNHLIWTPIIDFERALIRKAEEEKIKRKTEQDRNNAHKNSIFF